MSAREYPLPRSSKPRRFRRRVPWWLAPVLGGAFAACMAYRIMVLGGLL